MTVECSVYVLRYNNVITVLQDQSGYLFGPSLAATLNNIPTALHWWTEECKLLDGDSSPDCVTGM
jgi:hypothetical protein